MDSNLSDGPGEIGDAIGEHVGPGTLPHGSIFQSQDSLDVRNDCLRRLTCCLTRSSPLSRRPGGRLLSVALIGEPVGKLTVILLDLRLLYRIFCVRSVSHRIG